jgi:hypothetical protein
MRKWENMQNDEIYSIWKGYCMSSCRGDPLCQSDHPKPMRLTYVEVHALVEELLNRLDIKQKNEEK